MAKKRKNTITTKATTSRKPSKQSVQNVIITANVHANSGQTPSRRIGGESVSIASDHSEQGTSNEQSFAPKNVVNKLCGSYKGKRKHQPAPVIIIVECPSCGWRTQPNEIYTAEIEYVLHLENVHHGILTCAFCDPATTNRGQRILPSFETLAAHVRHFHPERFADCPEQSENAIPAKAFR